MTAYSWFIRGDYHAELVQTSMAAVRKACPGARLIVATDEDRVIPDVEMVRFDPGLPLMAANIEAQLAVMWAVREPIVFLDTDVLVLKPFEVSIFDSLTVTWRSTVGGQIEDVKGGIADVMPYNFGIFCAHPGPRVFEAFVWLRERIRAMAPSLQQWWGNQIALNALCGPRPDDGIRADLRQIPWRLNEPSKSLRVVKIPGEIWNYTPRSEDEDVSGKGAIHFKGHTRNWMKSRALSMGLPYTAPEKSE